MRSRLLVFVLGLLFTASQTLADSPPPTKPESVGLSSERLLRLKSVIQAEIDANRMPGAVVMIARRGKLAYSETLGFLDRDKGLPLRPDSIFRIMSMTKPLTAVMTMMLVEEGKLQLADPVAKYLPAFAAMNVLVTDKDGNVTTEPAKKPITIQDLLRHTAGFDYAEISVYPQIKAAYQEAGLYDPNGTPYDLRNVTPEQEVAGLAKAPLIAQPGSNWHYGVAYDVLGRVLETVTGKRLGALLEERLFRPLRMTDTGFSVPANQWSRIAEPLPIDPMTGKANIPVLDVKAVPANDAGGAGAVSTAADYMRFCLMLLNGGSLDGTRYLSPTTIRLMTSDQLGSRTTLPAAPGDFLMGAEGYGFGLGFMIRKGPGLAPVPGSEGEYLWGGAYGTFFWIDPKEQMAVVIMAQTPGAIRASFRRFKQMVAQAIVD